MKEVVGDGDGQTEVTTRASRSLMVDLAPPADQKAHCEMDGFRALDFCAAAWCA